MKISPLLTICLSPALGWAQEIPQRNPWQAAPVEIPEAVTKARVKAQTVTKGGGKGGGNLVVQVIEPPAFDAVTPVPAPVVKRLSAEERAAKIAAAKNERMFLPTVVIYDNGISLVRWWPTEKPGEQEYFAWVNLDLSSIGSCGGFTVGQRRYNMLPLLTRGKKPLAIHRGVATQELPAVPGKLTPPALTDFKKETDIILAAGDPNNQDAMEPLLGLLAKYDTEGKLIEAAYTAIREDQKARTAWEKANPEPTTDTVIKIWEIPRSERLATPSK